jgi:hypothetical protein
VVAIEEALMEMAETEPVTQAEASEAVEAWAAVEMALVA